MLLSCTRIISLYRYVCMYMQLLFTSELKSRGRKNTLFSPLKLLNRAFIIFLARFMSATEDILVLL